MPPALAVVGRTHLLLLHFPIALLFAVLAVELVLRKRLPGDRRREMTSAVLLAAALGAVAAASTGLLYAQSEDFHGRELVLIGQHRIAGIVTAVLAVATFIAHRRAQMKVAYLPLLVLATGAVTFAGHRGGELVHGEGYVLKALDQKKDGKDDAPDRIVASDGDDSAQDTRLRWAEGTAVEHPDYLKDVKPIIDRSCLKCHGPEKRKSGLRLDKKRYAMKGGETGLAIVPGDVEKSLLTKYIQLPPDDDDVMPSKGKLLAQSEIETLKRWVAQGAAWPDDSDAK